MRTVERLLGTSGLLPISPRTVIKTSLTPDKESNGDAAGINSGATLQKRAFGTRANSQSAGFQQLASEPYSRGIRHRAAILR